MISGAQPRDGRVSPQDIVPLALRGVGGERESREKHPRERGTRMGASCLRPTGPGTEDVPLTRVQPVTLRAEG